MIQGCPTLKIFVGILDHENIFTWKNLILQYENFHGIPASWCVVRMSIFTWVDLLLDLLEDNICETSWQLMLFVFRAIALERCSN